MKTSEPYHKQLIPVFLCSLLARKSIWAEKMRYLTRSVHFSGNTRCRFPCELRRYMSNFSASATETYIHESVVSTIGNTPVVKLSEKIKAHYEVPTDVNIYVKMESMNPGGSIKDRLAVGVLDWAEKHGQITPGQTVVEATSGNTGIGLAVACASRGYPFVCVMSEAFSIERRKLMRYLGAKVVLTNPAFKGSGMAMKAQSLAEEHGWFQPLQFENEANTWIHKETTGPEIVSAFKENNGLDFFVTAYGTGGTLTGVGAILREKSPKTKIVVCEPDNAPLLYSQVKPRGKVDPHPLWRPHLLQGWAPDFLPKLVQDAVEANLIDDIRHVAGSSAIDTSRNLARFEGILSGISGGGTVSVALELSKTLPSGSNVLAIVADTAERYLSTPLFDGIGADMTDEEKNIAASTPDTPPPPIDLPAVTEEALAFVQGENSKNKVVVWSLEYCEFCWTIFRLFDQAGVPYRAINVDAFEYAKDNMGNKYRSALQSITDCNTFPQCFIDGVFFGGAADAVMKWKTGELQQILIAAGVDNDKFDNIDVNPFEFLPKWMSANPLRSK